MVRQRSKGIESDGGGGADVNPRVAGDNGTPAGSAMLGDCLLKSRLVFVVEPAGRFVEKPDRGRRRNQPGERDPPTLARGEPAARPVGNPVEGECGQRCVEEARRPAQLRTPECCPERQGFTRRKTGFHAILMTYKVQMRAIGGALGLDWRNAPEKTAAGRHDQCGEDTQQAGLAAAVGSCEQQSAPCRKPKREPGKDQTLAAPASETLGDQIGSGQRARRAKKRLRWGKTGAAWPRSNCSTEYEVWGTKL
jgi:hypothetical protein